MMALYFPRKCSLSQLASFLNLSRKRQISVSRHIIGLHAHPMAGQLHKNGIRSCATMASRSADCCPQKFYNFCPRRFCSAVPSTSGVVEAKLPDGSTESNPDATDQSLIDLDHLSPDLTRVDVPKLAAEQRLQSNSHRNRKYLHAEDGNRGPNYEKMLQEIVHRLEVDGTPVALMVKNDSPGADTPLVDLYQAGADPFQIVDFFHVRPELLGSSRERWVTTLKLFAKCGFPVESVLEIIAVDPELLHVDPERLLLVINSLTSMNLSSESAHDMIRTNPKILSLEPLFIRTQINELKEFFTTTQLNYVVRKNPGLLFRNAEELREVYEYIYFEMGIEQPQIKKSHFWKRPLEFVMTRHELLVRAGVYVMPDPKRVMVGKDNPKLVQILDTSDYEFATEVAGITLEEYNVFEAMFHRQLEEEATAAGAEGPNYSNDLDFDGDEVNEEDGKRARTPKRKSSNRGGRKAR